jgi:hypothetical protein
MLNDNPLSNTNAGIPRVKLADGSYSVFAFLYFTVDGAKAMVPDRGLVPLAR